MKMDNISNSIIISLSSHCILMYFVTLCIMLTSVLRVYKMLRLIGPIYHVYLDCPYFGRNVLLMQKFWTTTLFVVKKFRHQASNETHLLKYHMNPALVFYWKGLASK